MKYQFNFPGIYILNVLLLLKNNFYMSDFDCLGINNKCGFRLANRFTQREVFKVFITKDNEVRTD